MCLWPPLLSHSLEAAAAVDHRCGPLKGHISCVHSTCGRHDTLCRGDLRSPVGHKAVDHDCGPMGHICVHSHCGGGLSTAKLLHFVQSLWRWKDQ